MAPVIAVAGSCGACAHGFLLDAAAFRFHKSASDQLWYHGAWRQLPELQHARVGGAMAVMGGKLYITGGVCETTGQFQDTAECLDCEDSLEWRSDMARAVNHKSD
eukprot:Skav211922  [mRNA]  locus=scaffold1086:66158:69083:+ [translate_table: standard]